MARRIEGTIYRLTYTATWHDYVECSSKEDLFKYVAQEVANGQIVTSVNEMCKDGNLIVTDCRSHIRVSSHIVIITVHVCVIYTCIYSITCIITCSCISALVEA